MSSKTKGNSFERLLARQLSNWWTDDERDDIFWRTSNSGGRATIRGEKGLKTAGSYGDLGATDPIGDALFKVLTIEIKRGYNKCSPSDLLDCANDSAQQTLEEWIQQAEEARKRANSLYWMIIHKRDRRKILVYFPFELKAALRKYGGFRQDLEPVLHLIGTFRFIHEIEGKKKTTEFPMTICGGTLDNFLHEVSSEQVKKLL